MSVIKKFLHTRMRVNDLEKTVDFYKEIFHLQEVKRSESPRGSKLVFLQVPNSDELIEIAYFPNSGPVALQADWMHIAFEVEDMDAFSEHIKRLGISFSEGPTQSGSGSKFAFIDAPDGYEIEIISYPPKQTN